MANRYRHIFEKARALLGLGLLPLFLAGLLNAQATQPAPKFLQFVPDNREGGQLQTAIVTYRNKAGQTVDLVGAVHVADASYFADLNKRFTQYDGVLYEMVKPRDVVPGRGAAPRPQGITRPMGWVGILQQGLKNVLDLSFQLDEIDYTRPNFVHADLDIDTFLQRQEERGESMFTLMLQQKMRELAKDQPTETVNIVELVAALQSPDRPRQLKLVLAKQFNEMDAMLSGLGGPDGTVIVGERNRHALKVLRERLDKGDKKLAIFYGAAHLKEMEKDMIDLMGFTQEGKPVWLTAWDMRAAPTTRPAVPAMR